MIFTKKNDRALSRDFRAAEFLCPCCGYALIDVDIVQVVQRVRDLTNERSTINSGWRCPRHNLKIHGATFSTHLLGCASDITWATAVQDLADENFRQSIRQIPLIRGIGWGRTYLHVDTWEGRASLTEWSYL